jgi:hypothetical protein
VTVALTAGAVDYLVARLDLWLDTMRGPAGYGGPVVHWWRDCLAFCGAAMDWRYEGIIAGYLTLYELTGAARWLDKAKRAGDDLLGGQTPSGHFWNSEFELNPGVGGTPHEAAADIGLLLLARALKAQGHADWERYLHAARRNLQRFYIEQLWYEPEGIFWDDPNHYTFVPNKSATLIEALCLLAASRAAAWTALSPRTRSTARLWRATSPTTVRAACPVCWPPRSTSTTIASSTRPWPRSPSCCAGATPTVPSLRWSTRTGASTATRAGSPGSPTCCARSTPSARTG